MLTPAIELRHKLSAHQEVVGVMATDHLWPLLVELCQRGGLDYLIVDREHGYHSDQVVADVCQVARLANFPVLMRTVSCDVAELRRAIDLGPAGLLLPCVERVEQLEQVREAVLMPPRGKRRPGGMGNYWLTDFNYETWRSQFEEHFLVIPQIETAAGVAAVDQIVSHPLVTALGLGPYDLSADLGCCWDPADPRHRQAIARIREAADRADKRLWIGCDAASLRAEGYTFLWIGSVSSVLTTSFQRCVNEVRAPLAKGDAPPSPPPA